MFWGITYWLWPNTAFFSGTGGKYDSYSQIRIFTVLICPKHMVVLFSDLDRLDEFPDHLVARTMLALGSIVTRKPNTLISHLSE
jgi:hypothetical protein